jgi:KDO2-lipid IV(A) lauroyltransferase
MPKSLTLKHQFEYLLLNAYFHFARFISIETSSSLFGLLFKRLGPHLKASKYARIALKKCLPHLDQIQRDNVLKKVWENFGRTVAEIPYWHDMDTKEFNSRVKVIDKTNGSFFNAKGSLLISLHYGNWELLPQFLSLMKMRTSIVYRHANNSLVDKMIINIRERQGINMIPKGVIGLKSIYKVLKSGGLVGMLIDQKNNTGEEIDFLGFSAKTTTAPAGLALKLKTPIFIARVIRGSAATFHIELEEFQVLENDDEISLTKRLHAKFEQWIKEQPEQWFWLHKRWGKDFYKPLLNSHLK